MREEISRIRHKDRLLAKLNKLKLGTQRASQVVLDKIDRRDPSKYVIVNVDCIEELIKNQH